jgi:hypothetical protein
MDETFSAIPTNKQALSGNDAVEGQRASTQSHYSGLMVCLLATGWDQRSCPNYSFSSVGDLNLSGWCLGPC